MLKNLPNFMRGYVRIKISGTQKEKLINRFASRSVSLWKITLDKNYIEANMSLNDFYNIKPILRNTNFKLRSIKRYGLPFIINKYKKRKFFVFGMLFTLLVLLVLSNIIWDINIYGTERIDREKVIKVVKEAGLTIGKPKFMLNFKEIEDELYKKIGDIAWLNIYQKGTSINIDIAETVIKTSETPPNIPCDIVADKEAIVYDIVTLKGVPKVKAKDVVNEGEVLVSGEIDVEQDGEKLKKYVHASAKIEGKNYLYVTVEQEIEETKKAYTGNIYKEIRLNLPLFSFNFIKTKPNASLAEKNEKYILLNPFVDNSKLGCTLNKYKEYKLYKRKYTIDEAKKRLQKKIYENLSNNLPADSRVVDVGFDYTFKENKVIAHGVATIIGKIGKNKNIEILEIK
ncbi:MAG: hypothetical protein A2Y24_02365 [Clostridiales bacterium GWE2_32_10]|nr:MAG: hypothetical protein A2Y24_02365 [Clostridiales bacterium GWE2_32_10]HBY20466.1 hypothetical protein [Clostridiales bacterium]